LDQEYRSALPAKGSRSAPVNLRPTARGLFPLKWFGLLYPRSRGQGQGWRRREQKKRWFRNGQKWRTGCEGRISVVKRRHGLTRCRYKGDNGMKRWIGLGVIADNLINIGNALSKQASPSGP